MITNRTNKMRKGLLEDNLSNSPQQMKVLLFLQRNAANRSTLLCIGNLGINLCRCYILVAEITLHYGNTCPCVQLETGKAVTRAMIGDMLGDPCIFQPIFQWCLCHGILEVGEYLASFLW